MNRTITETITNCWDHDTRICASQSARLLDRMIGLGIIAQRTSDGELMVDPKMLTQWLMDHPKEDANVLKFYLVGVLGVYYRESDQYVRSH